MKSWDFPKHAGEGEIRQRYLELVRAFPPEQAPERFAAMHAAYQALRDPAARLESQLFGFECQDDSLETLAERPPADDCATSGFRSKPCCPWQILHERSSRRRRHHRPLSRVARLLRAPRPAARPCSSLAAGAEPDAVREFGIIDLIEEFTALRHEMKLQTKSSRGLSEQTDTTLAALKQAIEQFRSVEPKEAQAAWTAGKALAEGLADLDEALDRGEREIERARRQIAELSPASLEAELHELHRSRSWIRRRLLRRYHSRSSRSSGATARPATSSSTRSWKAMA